MDRLDTYGVGQKQWGGCELTRQATPLLLSHCSIRSKRLTMIFLLSSGGKRLCLFSFLLRELTLDFILRLLAMTEIKLLSSAHVA